MKNEELHRAACAALPACLEMAFAKFKVSFQKGESLTPSQVENINAKALDDATTLAVTIAAQLNKKVNSHGEY